MGATEGPCATVDDLAKQGIAYVPCFPLGGFSPSQSSTMSQVAEGSGKTPMQVALARLLHRTGKSLLISKTSSVRHLRENLAAEIELSAEVLEKLDSIGSAA